MKKQEVFSIAQYIPFTDEQKRRASAIDLEAFLRSRGERLLRSGKDKRLASDRSVTVRGSEWYDHAADRGGGPVSFLQRFYRMSYPEAMCTLLGGAYPPVPESVPKPREAFRANAEGSDPRYSFHHIGGDGSLYVFEAPIDLLSFITLHPDRWREHSYVACCRHRR